MITPKEQIEQGDKVSIYWENVQNIFSAIVLHAASGPGEVWIVQEHNGKVHYVQSYSRMTLEKKASNEIPDQDEREFLRI